MEQSAFEALILGVSVFIFIIALSAAVLLMSNVLDMVNFANEQATVGMNGTLAETVGIVNERTYTASQLLSFYEKALNNKLNALDFKVRLSDTGQEKTIASFVSTDLTQYLNREFVLEYKGKIGNKDTYVFSLKTDS